MRDVSDHERIRALVARTAQLLDDGRYEEFLQLFTDDGTYSMQAVSAELGKEVTWMALDRSELSQLFKEYPEHVVDTASRLHLVTTAGIELGDGAANAVSTFAVYRTDLHGASALYAVGRYEDDFVLRGEVWKLRSRRVRLQTRQFTVPTPLPL
jgi:3-phenylpropionate/cinnamic acid dioxygenase small subunit